VFALRDGMGSTAKFGAAAVVRNVTKLVTINSEEPTKYQGLRPFEELTTDQPEQTVTRDSPGSFYHAESWI